MFVWIYIALLRVLLIKRNANTSGLIKKTKSNIFYPWNHESDSCPMRANANFIPGIERVPACEIRRVIFILRNLTHSDLWNPVIYPSEPSTFRSYEIDLFYPSESNTFRSYESQLESIPGIKRIPAYESQLFRTINIPGDERIQTYESQFIYPRSLRASNSMKTNCSTMSWWKLSETYT